jgi:hypothetical protein
MKFCTLSSRESAPRVGDSGVRVCPQFPDRKRIPHVFRLVVKRTRRPQASASLSSARGPHDSHTHACIKWLERETSRQHLERANTNRAHTKLPQTSSDESEGQERSHGRGHGRKLRLLLGDPALPRVGGARRQVSAAAAGHRSPLPWDFRVC